MASRAGAVNRGLVRRRVRRDRAGARGARYRPQMGETTSEHRRFVCYARADEYLVHPVVEEWRRAGDAVFRDVDSLSPGSAWRDRIRDAIDQCDSFHIFWSASASASAAVRDELSHAVAAVEKRRQEGRGTCRIIPELLDSTPLPPGIADANAADRRRPGSVPTAVWIGVALAAIWASTAQRGTPPFGVWSWATAVGCLLAGIGWLEPWFRPVVARPLFALGRLVEARDDVVVWRAAEVIRLLWPIRRPLPSQGQEAWWWLRPGSALLAYGAFALGRMGWRAVPPDPHLGDVGSIVLIALTVVLASCLWAVLVLAAPWAVYDRLRRRLARILHECGGYSVLLEAETRGRPIRAATTTGRLRRVDWAGLHLLASVLVVLPGALATAVYGWDWAGGAAEYAWQWAHRRTSGAAASWGAWSQVIVLIDLQLVTGLLLPAALLLRVVFPGSRTFQTFEDPWAVAAEDLVRRRWSDVLDGVAREPLRYLGPGYTLTVLVIGMLELDDGADRWFAEPLLVPSPTAGVCITATPVTRGDWAWVRTAAKGMGGPELVDRSILLASSMPVQTWSWCDAARFANTASCALGLQPRYAVDKPGRAGAETPAVVCPPAGRPGSRELRLAGCELHPTTVLDGNGFVLPSRADVPAQVADDPGAATAAVAGGWSVWLGDDAAELAVDVGVGAWLRRDGVPGLDTRPKRPLLRRTGDGDSVVAAYAWSRAPSRYVMLARKASNRGTCDTAWTDPPPETSAPPLLLPVAPEAEAEDDAATSAPPRIPPRMAPPEPIPAW